MVERTLLRTGAVSAPLGVITLYVADAFHGGHNPADLEATLPEYAANANWEVVHIAQFLGYVLVFVSLVALYRSMAEGWGAALARLAYVTAVLATAIYAVNQAVDGVAVKFVADEWVSAPPAEKADAFRVAEAVRHIEIGTSSFAELTLGAALLALIHERRGRGILRSSHVRSSRKFARRIMLSRGPLRSLNGTINGT